MPDHRASNTTPSTPSAVPRATANERAWEWRLGLNHAMFDVDGKPTFHAHDVNDSAACWIGHGLVRTIAEPNEGSYLCPDCMVVVRSTPRGRPKRKPVDV